MARWRATPWCRRRCCCASRMRCSAAEAAPLCCAGWTAYGALREAALRPGQSVALFGMGGLGHLAIQYARHLGLRVAAVDVSESKLEMARALGADLAVLAENAGRTLAKAMGRRGRGHRPDRLARGDPAGFPVA